MPKSMMYTPECVFGAEDIKFQDIPVLRYNKTVKEEVDSGNFTKEDLLRIYRDMRYIREFEIILIKGAQTLTIDSDASVVIYGKKSDGTYFMQSCDISDGNILFCPKSDVLSVSGHTECQVQVLNGDNVIMFSPSFIISVSDAGFIYSSIPFVRMYFDTL